MARSNSNKPPQAIVPYGPVVRRSAQNGNRRREPMEEGIRGKPPSPKDISVVELFTSTRLEWDCKYCVMIYDGTRFYKKLPGRQDSVPLTEKEFQSFKFSVAIASDAKPEVLKFIERHPHKDL